MEKVACQIPEEGMAPAQPQPEQKQSSLALESGCYANPLNDVDPFIAFIHFFFFQTKNGCHAQSLHKIHTYFVLKIFFRLMMFVKHQVTNTHFSPLLKKGKSIN